MIEVKYNTLRLINIGRKTYLEIDGKPTGKYIEEVRFSHKAGRDAVLEVEFTEPVDAGVVTELSSGPDVDDVWQQLSASKQEALND